MDFAVDMEKINRKGTVGALGSPQAGGQSFVSSWLPATGIALGVMLSTTSLCAFLVWIIRRSNCWSDVVELCFDDKNINGCDEVLRSYHQCTPTNLLAVWVSCLVLGVTFFALVYIQRQLELQRQRQPNVLSGTEASRPHPVMSCYCMSAVRDNDLFSDAGDSDDEVIHSTNNLVMASPSDSMASM